MVWFAAAVAGAVEVELDGTVRWADGVALTVGASTWRLDDGFVFPVRTDDGEDAGLVFVGVGAAAFALDGPGEALALANTLATRGGVDAAVARTAIDQRRWSEGFDVALLVGSDPAVREAVRALPVLSENADDVLYFEEGGVPNVVVTGHRLGPARAQAEEVLRERIVRLTALGVDPRVGIRLDRFGTPDPRWLAEVRTERAWLPFIEPADVTTQDRWLSFAHDPTAAIDDTCADLVFVHGLSDRGTANGVGRLRVLGCVPRTGPVATPRITRAAVNVVVEPESGLSHRVSFEALVTVRAEVASRLVSLAIPRQDQPAPVSGTVLLQEAFVLRSVALSDGRPVEAVGAVFDAMPPRSGWVSDTFALPEALAAGEEVELRLRWTDRWPATHWLNFQEYGGGCRGQADPGCAPMVRGTPELANLGTVTESRPVLPVVPHQPARWPAEIRVGTTYPSAWVAAIGGFPPREVDLANGRWWAAHATGDARVSFGKLAVRTHPADAGFPGFRLLTHSLVGEGSPVFVRSVLNFYQEALPAYPYAEVVVLQGPDEGVLGYSTVGAPDRGFVRVDAVPGQIVVRGVQGETGTMDDDRPHAVERGMAEALAAHWWGTLPYPRRDAWIGPAAAAMYRDAFVREAYREDVADQWRRVRARDLASWAPRSALVPLTSERAPWSGEVGGQLLSALAERVGEPVVLEGLERFLLDPGPPTTERLSASLSLAAGANLRDFFDFWVTTGARPSVRGTWTMSGRDQVSLELVSDVPFGRFEVPVAVVTSGTARTTWVALVDGVASVDLQVRGEPDRVLIDPDGLLPLRGAAVDRLQPQPPGRRGRQLMVSADVP